MRRFALGVNHRDGTFGAGHCVPCRARSSFSYIERVCLQYALPIRNSLDGDILIPNLLFKNKGFSAFCVCFVRQIHAVRGSKNFRNPGNVICRNCNLSSCLLSQNVPMVLDHVSNIVPVHHNAKSTNIQAGILSDCTCHGIRNFTKICPVHILPVGKCVFHKGNRFAECGNHFVFLSTGQIDTFLLRKSMQTVFIYHPPLWGGLVLPQDALCAILRPRGTHAKRSCALLCRRGTIEQPAGQNLTAAQKTSHHSAAGKFLRRCPWIENRPFICGGNQGVAHAADHVLQASGNRALNNLLPAFLHHAANPGPQRAAAVFQIGRQRFKSASDLHSRTQQAVGQRIEISFILAHTERQCLVVAASGHLKK